MSRILIFAGTTEGRELAERLAKAGIACTVCVATEYGMQVMKTTESREDIEVLSGRRNEREMEALLQERSFAAIVDATHPFAEEVSKNIKESAEKQNVPYLRLKRDTAQNGCQDAEAKMFYYKDSAECAEKLEHTRGNILLTTGSKELSVYCAKESVKERLYVRVLPGTESFELCQKEHIPGKQILALQGPFSEEMNRAFIKEYRIEHLVTKESGTAGGVPQKINAAKREGVTIHIIGNPEAGGGLSFSQVCARLEEITGKPLGMKRKLRIALIGAGMGTKDGMTREAAQALDSAGYLFGAERLLALARPGQSTFPYYLAKEILPVLDTLLTEDFFEEERSVGILFSGDSGFYSGCEKLYRELEHWKEETEAKAEPLSETEIKLRIYPGISAVSYLSAASGISWQDAEILSIHGRRNTAEWSAEFKEAVRYHEKTFLLLSGVNDLNTIGRLLLQSGLPDCRIVTGYQCSYPEEEISELSPKECAELGKEGLYTCIILNGRAQKRPLTHGKKDALFLRDSVPMTKEEIREAAICKLQLCEDAVVYDIGSGTGSIAVEIAERSGKIRVFAVEQKEEAVALIRENCKKFQTENVEIVHAKAPEGLEALPAATHAFIGGTGGRMQDILMTLRRINPAMRVVITAISLETISEIVRAVKEIPVTEQEIVQIQVSRVKTAGSYSLMQAENPVYLCSFRFDGT
ncbi:MAG: precorrin-6A reductase [Lachnospiraceae bacterium]|nr:precorrin-6A reductase [Lachnospiraceae bacterium]